jgi:AraC-like DNA-binding protein
MARKKHKKLSGMERAAIAAIQQLRAAHLKGLEQGYLAERADILRELLRNYHGNVKLRLEVICPALGCTIRSLEREFLARYSETMHGYHELTRLDYAIYLMTLNPDVKLTAVAAELGYDRESEFNRFFRRKTGLSPTEFVRRVKFDPTKSGCAP